MKFQNKYRTSSIRLPHWDYSSEGYYYVTICTKNKKCYLGNILNGKMALSKIGEIVKEKLLAIESLHIGVKLDIWVIMPNHIHYVLAIVETCHWHVSTDKNIFGKPVSGSLSILTNQFKGIVKKTCNKNLLPFSWQSNYYEHVIRNDHELAEIREYIQNNPLKWELDDENPEKHRSTINYFSIANS